MSVLIREYSREWAEPAERPQDGTESDMVEDGQRGWSVGMRGRWGMGLNREAGSRSCLAWEALTKPAILEPLK